MFKNKYEEKLIHAMAYFAGNVKYPTQVKIFKLLFFLDFIHFKKTGKPVTGMVYYAWPFGPVPKALWQKIKENTLSDNITENISFEKEAMENGFEKVLIQPKVKADLKMFTPIQQAIIKDLIFIFKDTRPFEMSEITHLKNGPWDKTRKNQGEQAEIDYTLALDTDAMISAEEAKVSLAEFQEFQKNYHLEPV